MKKGTVTIDLDDYMSFHEGRQKMIEQREEFEFLKNFKKAAEEKLLLKVSKTGLFDLYDFTDLSEKVESLEKENYQLYQLKQEKLEILLQFKNMSVWDFLKYKKAANKK